MTPSRRARSIDARLASGGDQLGDDLDIILRDLMRMLFPRPAWMAMRERRTLADFDGLGSGRHGEAKQKNRPLTTGR